MAISMILPGMPHAHPLPTPIPWKIASSKIPKKASDSEKAEIKWKSPAPLSPPKKIKTPPLTPTPYPPCSIKHPLASVPNSALLTNPRETSPVPEHIQFLSQSTKKANTSWPNTKPFGQETLANTQEDARLLNKKLPVQVHTHFKASICHQRANTWVQDFITVWWAVSRVHKESFLTTKQILQVRGTTDFQASLGTTNQGRN